MDARSVELEFANKASNIGVLRHLVSLVANVAILYLVGQQQDPQQDQQQANAMHSIYNNISTTIPSWADLNEKWPPPNFFLGLYGASFTGVKMAMTGQGRRGTDAVDGYFIKVAQYTLGNHQEAYQFLGRSATLGAYKRDYQEECRFMAIPAERHLRDFPKRLSDFLYQSFRNRLPDDTRHEVLRDLRNQAMEYIKGYRQALGEGDAFDSEATRPLLEIVNNEKTEIERIGGMDMDHWTPFELLHRLSAPLIRYSLFLERVSTDDFLARTLYSNEAGGTGEGTAEASHGKKSKDKKKPYREEAKPFSLLPTFRLRAARLLETRTTLSGYAAIRYGRSEEEVSIPTVFNWSAFPKGVRNKLSQVSAFRTDGVSLQLLLETKADAIPNRDRIPLKGNDYLPLTAEQLQAMDDSNPKALIKLGRNDPAPTDAAGTSAAPQIPKTEPSRVMQALSPQTTSRIRIVTVDPGHADPIVASEVVVSSEAFAPANQGNIIGQARSLALNHSTTLTLGSNNDFQVHSGRAKTKAAEHIRRITVPEYGEAIYELSEHRGLSLQELAQEEVVEEVEEEVEVEEVVDLFAMDAEAEFNAAQEMEDQQMAALEEMLQEEGVHIRQRRKTCNLAYFLNYARSCRRTLEVRARELCSIARSKVRLERDRQQQQWIAEISNVLHKRRTLKVAKRVKQCMRRQVQRLVDDTSVSLNPQCHWTKPLVDVISASFQSMHAQAVTNLVCQAIRNEKLLRSSLCIVFFGSFAGRSSSRTYASVPRKFILQQLSKEGLVVILDEFNTSKWCPCGGSVLVDAEGGRLRTHSDNAPLCAFLRDAEDPPLPTHDLTQAVAYADRWFPLNPANRDALATKNMLIIALCALANVQRPEYLRQH